MKLLLLKYFICGNDFLKFYKKNGALRKSWQKCYFHWHGYLHYDLLNKQNICLDYSHVYKGFWKIYVQHIRQW